MRSTMCGKNIKRNERKRSLKYKYELTLSDYEAMLVSQNNVCEICGLVDDEKRLAIDHDHKTGTVRGLLCQKCNVGLGYFKDNTELLQNAIVYLNKDRN